MQDALRKDGRILRYDDKVLAGAPLFMISTLGVLATACVIQAETYPDTRFNAEIAARYQPVLNATPRLELPAKAAGLVEKAKPEQREATAIAVLRVVSRINAASVPPTVGAIARVEPRVSTAVVKEAQSLQPKLASEIRLAAASSSTISGPTLQTIPSPTPEPTGGDGHGKKKGHYKRP